MWLTPRRSFVTFLVHTDEALVSLLNQSEAKGKLHGIQLATNSPRVHHLLFADDILLLCEANTVESEEVMRCLKVYGEASGQMINVSKSSIIFGASIDDTTKEEVKQVMGINSEGGE